MHMHAHAHTPHLRTLQGGLVSCNTLPTCTKRRWDRCSFWIWTLSWHHWAHGMAH